MAHMNAPSATQVQPGTDPSPMPGVSAAMSNLNVMSEDILSTVTRLEDALAPVVAQRDQPSVVSTVPPPSPAVRCQVADDLGDIFQRFLVANSRLIRLLDNLDI